MRTLPSEFTRGDRMGIRMLIKALGRIIDELSSSEIATDPRGEFSC
jgi:hypothetical protein